MGTSRFLTGLLLLLVSGCAVPRPGGVTGIRPEFPPDAFITQRATLTVRGRQFALNGYVARNRHGALRLIVTGSLGNVLADLLVRPDGDTTVLRCGGGLRREWIARYMAADLKCIFGSAADPGCMLVNSAPDHQTIERRGYRLDLRTVEIRPGAQPAHLFEPDASSPP